MTKDENMLDREIIEWKVKNNYSKLIKAQQAKVYDLIEEHCDMVKLSDEIGRHWQFGVHLKLHNGVPFFVHP